MYAVILAGGKGERLLPLTLDRPKPMVEVNGKPILDWQIHQLKEAGVTDVIICESYLPEVIQTYFGDGERFDIGIHHLPLDFSLNSAGAIKEAVKQIPQDQEEFVCLYGDIIWDGNIKDVITQHQKEQPMATIVIAEHVIPKSRIPGNMGIIEYDEDGMITQWNREPTIKVNAAIGVLSWKIETYLNPGESFYGDTIPGLQAKDIDIKAFLHEGFWADVADTNDLERTSKYLQDNEINRSIKREKE